MCMRDMSDCIGSKPDMYVNMGVRDSPDLL